MMKKKKHSSCDDTWPLVQPVLSRWSKTIAALKSQYPFWRLWAARSAPWLFVVGEPGSGKTTLLARAGVSLKGVDIQAMKGIEPTEDMDFWLGERVLLADISGEWCWGDSQGLAEERWKYLLRRWQKFRFKKAYTKALVVLDCSKIQTHDAQSWQDYISRLSSHCQLMQSIMPTIQFTFVLTKADCLLGFTAFFALLSPEERQQLCGVAVTHKEGKTVSESCALALKGFLERINQLTIARLHNEQNVLRRDLLRAFPQRLAMLVETLLSLIEVLPGRVQSALTGVYLTSAEQQAESENVAETSSLIVADEMTVGSRPYFIRELLLQLITKQSLREYRKTIRWYWTGSHVLIGVSIVLGMVMVLHAGFVSTRKALDEAKLVLTQPAQTLPDEPYWLTRLTQLSQTRAVLMRHRLMYYRWLGYAEGDQLIKTIDKHYKGLLEKELLPYLNGLFEKVLRQDWKASPLDPRLYYDLKGYQQWLLLPPEKHDERLSLIKSVWTRLEWSHQKQADMMLHVKALLQDMPVLPSSTHVLKEAQAVMLSLPKEQIIWMIVRLQAMNQAEPVMKQLGDSFLFDHVNPVYLPENNAQLKNEWIPEAIKRASTDAELLGRHLFSASDVSNKTLIDAVYQRYLMDLDRYWHERLKEVAMLPVNDLASLRLQFYDLTNTDSAVWQWFKRLLALFDEARQPLANDFFWKQLRSVTASGDDQEAFQGISKQIQTFLSACVTPEATFSQAKEAMASPAKDPLGIMYTLSGMMADPLRHWLSSLSHQAWSFLIGVAQKQINHNWSTKVYPFFKKSLEGRYPLNSDAKKDIARHDFDHFFKPGGLIQVFFEKDLLPFIDVKKNHWSMKKRAGVGLNLSQDRLAMLIRSSDIQKMFYQDNRVTNQVGFALMPDHLSKDIHAVTVTIAGQTFDVVPGSVEGFAAKWPGEGGDYAVLQIQPKVKKPVKIDFWGPWAFFRLLASAKMEVTKDPSLYRLSWSVGSYAFHAQLRADHAVNPYTPNSLNAFVLWPTLIDR